MLPVPPHWATSRPPGRMHGGEVPEERVVIGDPVEGGGREDRVHRSLDRERAPQVRPDEVDPVAEPGQPAAGLVEHRRRGVEGDHVAAGQSLGQGLGHPAAAATGIEDASRRRPA